MSLSTHAAGLTAHGLTKRFGGLTAVNDVSFEVRPGEVFGLIGPNGAGKTTLFNLMTGLTPPSAGQLLLDGVNVTGLSPHRIAARGVGRTFQNIRLFKTLSALDNVRVGGHLDSRAGLWSGIFGADREAEARLAAQAWELLDLVGLSDRAGQAAGHFSYGDQRRLEIARALALSPRALLLDEPAAGMNTGEKQGLGDFIRDLRTRFDLTILLIEHHVPLVMGLCDRVAVLNFGQLIAVGEPAAVQQDPRVIEAYLGAP